MEYPEWVQLVEMQARHRFAALAPEPTKDQIEFEGERDRLANPHGDTYKPRRRSRMEIIADLRFQYADAMMARSRQSQKGE